MPKRGADRGAASMAASRIATLTTRPAKRGVEDPVRLHERWQQEAQALGFGRQQLLDLVARRPVERDLAWPNDVDSERGNVAPHLARAGLPAGELDEVTRQRLQNELLGPTGLTAHTSTFHHRDIVRAVCDRLPDGASAASIQELTAQILRSPPHRPAAPDGRGGRSFPVRRTVPVHHPGTPGLERRILTVAANGRKIGRAQVPIPLLRQTLNREDGLSLEQRHMVGRLCHSGNLLDVVAGVPGAGKTRSLAAAHTASQAAGIPVLGCSVKATAAAELQTGPGIPAWTVARLLLDLDGTDPVAGGSARLPDGAVLVVDEAGMLAPATLPDSLPTSTPPRA